MKNSKRLRFTPPFTGIYSSCSLSFDKAGGIAAGTQVVSDLWPAIYVKWPPLAAAEAQEIRVGQSAA
jgi:hypothetical protein